MRASISVVIPTHNRIGPLERALASIDGQSYPASEVLVIDDGSDDGTEEMVAARFPDVRVLRQPNRGVSSARNRGVRAARHEWIAFLDSDDEWMPGKLESQVGALEAEPNHRLVHCDEIWVRNGVRVNQRRRHQKVGGMIFQHCLPLCAISPSAVVIHRSVFDDVGFFDENLPACEDYDLWLRFTASNPVLFVDQPLVLKRGGHADQLSRSVEALDKYRIRALTALLDSEPLERGDREAAVATLLDKIRIYKAGAVRREHLDEVESLERLTRRFENESAAAQGGVRKLTFLVTALQSEARPLVEHFRLKGTDSPSPYRLYRGDEITLVVSGVGRIASAAATAYAFAHDGERRNRPWLNVGIAGHADAATGSVWLAHKVTDESSRRAWYPSLVFDPGVATAEVVTVDRPETGFERDALYDMEASAFFAIASRFALVELVHVLKVVSDNHEAPASGLKAADVTNLVGEHVNLVADLVGKMAVLAGRLPDVTVDPEPWMGDHHFTVSQERRLRDLLRRLTVLEGTVVSPEDSSSARDARALLAALEDRLSGLGTPF